MFQFNYSIIQWLFFFYFYSFCGWCFESTYVSIRTKKLTNRGFMRGPFLPLYGSGGLMMLVASAPFRSNIVLTYVAGVIGATMLEYVTGVAMEKLFKVRYWDYSKRKFNFQGQICLSSSLAWGFLTIAMTHFVHEPVEKLVLAIPNNILTSITVCLSFVLAGDFTLAFKNALDMRDILIMMSKVRETAVEAATNVKERAAEAASSMKATAVDAKNRVSENILRRVWRTERDRAYHRSVFRGNPSMTTSERFRAAFEEFKRSVAEYRKEDED